MAFLEGISSDETVELASGKEEKLFKDLFIILNRDELFFLKLP